MVANCIAAPGPEPMHKHRLRASVQCSGACCLETAVLAQLSATAATPCCPKCHLPTVIRVARTAGSTVGVAVAVGEAARGQGPGGLLVAVATVVPCTTAGGLLAILILGMDGDGGGDGMVGGREAHLREEHGGALHAAIVVRRIP
eukprot:5986045-Alexandrium_andersonii.AAC.1